MTIVTTDRRDGRVLVTCDALERPMSKLADGTWVEGMEFTPYDEFHNFERVDPKGAEHSRLLAEAVAAGGN